MRGRLLLLVALLGCAPAAADPGALQAALASRAQALLSALPEAQRRAIAWSFADPERRDIHYAPIFLEGVPLGELEPAPRSLAEELLATALSARGVEKVRTIRELELAVLEKERRSVRGLVTRWLRDPGRYLLAFFGEPSRDAPWGFRFEGHHVSLHVTSRPGSAPATTPLFLGAEPRRVPDGWPSAGVAALGEEESLARRLVSSLDPAQRARATLDYRGGRALLLGEVRTLTASEAIGLRRDAMSVEQRALLDALIESFVSNWSGPIAAARRAEIDAAGRDSLRFAWAEASEPEGAFYLRVQGPSLLLEIDNTEDGDHVHAIWHDPRRDFGADPLALHRQRAHVNSSALTSTRGRCFGVDERASSTLEERPRVAQRRAIGFTTICTAPSKRGGPSTNRNS